MKKNNKGFSLVELIIVIAIMAILVGVLAPNLIKQLEKSKVASDLELCDAIHEAVIVALADTEVLDDSASESQIDWFTGVAPDTGWYMEFQCADCKFKDSIVETLGFDVFDATLRKSKIKSSAKNNGGDFYIFRKGTQFYIGIFHSDVSGRKQDITQDPKRNIISPACP